MTIALGSWLTPAGTRADGTVRVDWVGSLPVTGSVMSAIYAIVEASAVGWGSGTVLGFLGLAAALMAVFVAVEARIDNPIMPLRILRVPGLVSSSIVRGLLVTGMYSTFFLGTLYPEHVLHYDALKTGLSWARSRPAAPTRWRRPTRHP